MEKDAKRYDDMTPEKALEIIKKKKYSDLDKTDLNFLAARKDYLTEQEVAIYLNGKDPVKVLGGKETTVATYNDEQEAILEEAVNRIRAIDPQKVSVPVEPQAPLVVDPKLAWEKSVRKMTKPQLTAQAKLMGVVFDSTETNADLIAKILALPVPVPETSGGAPAA